MTRKLKPYDAWEHHSAQCGVPRMVITDYCDGCHRELHHKMEIIGRAKYRAAHGTEPAEDWDCFFNDEAARILMTYHRHHPDLSIDAVYDKLDFFSGKYPRVARPPLIKRLLKPLLQSRDRP